MPEKQLSKGDIVQITDEYHPWYPALLIVEKSKPNVVMGYTTIVTNNPDEPNGNAYVRLTSDQVKKVGTAVIVAE